METGRAHQARQRSKDAHLRAAEAFDRAATHYERLAKLRTSYGDDEKAASLRAKAKASRVEAFEQRAKAEAEFADS